MTTVAETLVNQMAAWGVNALYGVAGDTILPFLDALSHQDQIKFYSTKHESSAGFMASAQAKQGHGPGFCLVHAGPGLANILNGVADAANDHVPMVLLSGQVPSTQIGTDEKQYLDEQRLVSPLSIFSAQISSVDSAVDLLKKAYHLSIQNQGVTHLSIPLDILEAQINPAYSPPEPYLNTAAMSTPEVVKGTIPLLSSFERPLILLGKGGRSAADNVLRLAERWGAGIILSLGAKGSIPGRHPLVIGGLGQGGSPVASSMLKAADGLLVIGSTWWPKAYVPEHIPIVQIDRIPGHIGLSSPVAYGLVGDARLMMEELLIHWRPFEHSAWAQRVREENARWWEKLGHEAQTNERPIHPERIIADLEEEIAPDAIITLDVGDHTVWFNRVFRGEYQEIVLSGNWRSMGFGLPAAIQAKIHQPQRQVVAFVGDGGFAMTQMEFCTAARYRLPIMVVVVNNGCLAMEKNRMLTSGMTPYGVDNVNPDFVMLAKACGGDGRRVDDPSELRAAFHWGLSENRPILIDVQASAPILPHMKSE